MELEVFTTPGLGDNTYLLLCGDEALLVDPQRDARRFLAHAEARGATIRHVLETHVHNDYVSGALEIRAATGAEIGASARGGYSFAHRPITEGDELKLGDLRVVAMETPGHTPEHLCYLVYEPGSRAPAAVFTGGSLMVGSAGRTDLLGEELTETLTRAQFKSLRRLAALPDDVQVLPTHGAGSFCGAGPSGRGRTSTLGRERALNPALQAADEPTFLERQMSGLDAYPAYYANMAPINRAGPAVLGDITQPPTALTAEEAASSLDAGAWTVDARDRHAFARAHIPGSINVELGEDFASYVGWVVPFNAPLLLLLPEPEPPSAAEAATQLTRIGFERVAGFLQGGIEAWQSAGRAVRSYPTADVAELCREYRAGRSLKVLDVRQRSEWDEGHIPGSTHVMVGEIPAKLRRLPQGTELWPVCASGHRAALAASLLDKAGLQVRLVAEGGVPAWLRDCRPEETHA